MTPHDRSASSSVCRRPIILLLIATTLGLILSLQLLSIALAAPQAPTAPFATTITVDTSADLDPGSITKTCTYTSGVYVGANDGCTLRRAILEAAARPQADRPIAITFNLAPADVNANLEVSGTWTLPVEEELPPLRTDTILDLNGQVTIDGATQPGGRSNGPKIIVDTNDWSLEVESEENVIRNLAFKGGGVIFLKEDRNIVSGIWMGLSDDGQTIHFRTPGQLQRMAGGGVHILSNDNLVENNTISGAFARAINIDGGDGNTVQNNQIGTRADGTVPDVPPASLCERSFSFDPQSWYGGWGIALSGSNNKILDNRIAGLHILQSANETPPIAIEIFGTGHEVRNNVIGVDSADKLAGVCGQGIKVAGSDTQILDNEIRGSRAGFEDDAETAIMANDSSPTFGQITVRGNLVEDGPGNVYAFGPMIPVELRTFAPAKISSMAGVTITGSAGDGSPCPGCLIDLYQDDSDEIGEALVHLGSVVAGAGGDFSFILAQPLAAGTGLRTSSTTQSSGVIDSFGAGTTTRVSKLYLPISSISVTLPISGEIGSSYQVTVSVLPAAATAPFDYMLEATDAQTQTLDGAQSPVVVATYEWAQPGLKTITVTVGNELGTVTETHQINIVDPDPDPAQDEAFLFLPTLRRQ